MKIERFLIISTIALVVLVMAREWRDTFIPAVNASTVVNQDFIAPVIPTIGLGNIVMDPEIGDAINEFELTGVSFHMADSVWLFEPIYLTPEAGVKLTANKYFHFPADVQLNNPESILTITGVYKGTAIYFPISINDLISKGEKLSDEILGGQYTLNVTLKDLEQGSNSYLTPCHPEALDVSVLHI